MRLFTAILAFTYCVLYPIISSAEPVTVGLLAELSGDFARLGEDCKRGYEMAQAIYEQDPQNSLKKIRFVLGDNKGNAKDGLSEFRRLIDVDQAVAVVTTRSPVGLAINPVSKRQKVPLLGIVGHPSFINQNEYAFRFWPSAADEGESLAELARQEGRLKSAVLTVEDDFFLAISKSFETKFKSKGGEIVFRSSFLPQDHDFTTVIAQLRRARPDVLLLNLNPAQTSAFVKRLGEVRAEDLLVLSNFILGIPDVLNTVGTSADGAVFMQVDVRQPKFLKHLESQFGARQISPIGFSCFTGLTTLLSAISRTDGRLSNESVYASLQKIDKITLPDGSISISGREAELPLAFMVIQDGKATNR